MIDWNVFWASFIGAFIGDVILIFLAVLLYYWIF